jgi:hypothetical protein
MTEKALAAIAVDATSRWKLLDAIISHRIGPMDTATGPVRGATGSRPAPDTGRDKLVSSGWVVGAASLAALLALHSTRFNTTDRPPRQGANPAMG